MTTLMPGAIRPFPHYVMTNTSLRNAVPSTTTSKDANIQLPLEPERGAAPELPSQYWGDVNTTTTNSMPVQVFTVSASAHEFAQTVKATSHGQAAQQLANAPAVLEIHTKFGALQLDGYTQAGDDQGAQQHFAIPCYGKSDVSHSMDAQQAIASRCDGNGQIGHQHQELFGNVRFYHSETHTSRDKELSMSQDFAFRGHSIVGDSGEQTVHQHSEDDSADTNNLIARYCTTTRQVTDYGANVPISRQHLASEPHASLGATAEPSHRQLMNGKSDFGRSIASYYVANQRNTDLNGDGQIRRGNVEPGETCNASASSTAQYVGNVDGPTAHDYAADAQVLLNGENQVAPRWKATKQNAGISGGVQHALEFKDDQKSVGQGTNVPGKAIISVGENDGDRHITHNVLNGMGQPMPARTVLQHGSVDHAMKRHNSLRGNGKRDGNKQHASRDVITNHDGKVQNPQPECGAESNAGHQHTTHKADGNGQNSAEQAAPPHASVVKLAEFCANMVHQMWHVRGVSSYETADWPPNVPLHASANFKNWCYHVLTLTQLSETAVMLALKYIQMLIRSGRFSKIELGNQYRLCAVAFVLANKWLDDSTYLNKTWAEVTGIPLAELNGKEMSVLGSLEFNVQVSPDEYKRWIDSLQAYTKKQDELLYASPQPSAMVMPEPFDYLRPLTSSAGIRMPMPEQHPQQLPRFVGGLVPPPGFVFPPQEQPLRSAQEDDRAGKPTNNVLHSTDLKNIREPSAYLGHAKRYSMPNARELTREPAEQRRPSRLRPADAVALLSDGSHPLSTGNQTQSNVTASVAAVPTASPATKARTFSSLADFTRWYEQNASTARNPSNTVGVAGKQTGAEMSLVNIHANAVPRKSSLLDLLATDTSRRSQRHLSMPDFTRGGQAVHFKKGAFEPTKSAESDVYEQKSSFPDLAALLKSQQVIPGKDRQRIGVTIPYASSPEPLHRTPQLVRHDVQRFGGCAQPHTAIRGNSAINRKECCSPQTPVDMPRCGMDDDFANVSHGKPYGVNQAEQGIGLGGLLFLNHEDGKALL